MTIKKKSFVSLVIIGCLICSFIIVPFQTYAVDEESNTVESYIVIYGNGANRKVETINMNQNEAAKMEQENDVLVVEEGYVYGSETENYSNLKDFYSKDKQKKKVQRRSSENSDTEWNMQVIKADNITTEDLYDESVVTGPAFNVVTGPAINAETDSKVKVAIIDSGVDYTEDVDVYMRKNFIPGEDEVSIIYEDGCGHGTSVAGIIAAKDNDFGITGINPDVELYSAKVLDRNNTAPVSRVVEAIYWAIDNDVNIINISFGTTKRSAALEQSIKDAYDAGILLIAAAGNYGIIEYPAAYDEVIAVGSVNSKGERSEGSATGEDLELMAPGEQILSTGDFGGILVSSGTSMAAPHVTGVASILWQKDLSCSSEFIRKLLDISANLYGDREDYGYGVIDLEYALEQYDSFKAVYTENEPLDDIIEESQENGELLDNTSEVIIFDDVDYVEGSWGLGDHQVLAENGSFSGTELKVLKLGAVRSDRYLLGFTTYPQWHGYYKKKVSPIYLSNFMSSYIYITNMALGFSNSTSDTETWNMPDQPSYMSDNDFEALSSEIDYDNVAGIDWEEALESYKVSDRNKRLFVYGMALHTATDLFAHNTYTSKALNSNSYIDHDGGADVITFKTNRYDCAEAMAHLVLLHAYYDKPGLLSDFASVAKNNYNGTFFMHHYNDCARDIDTSYYESYSSYFDAISIYTDEAWDY